MSDALVEIVNTALGALGQEPVADLSEASLQQSVAAVKLMRSIEASRRTVLARHGWVCALEYAALAPLVPPAGYSNFRYPSLFEVPGGALRVWEVAGQVVDGRELPDCGTRWQFGTFEIGDDAKNVIRAGAWTGGALAALSSLDIAYVRLASWASLAPHVREAVAADCAMRQAYSITGDARTAQMMKAQAETMAVMAISIDATQEGGQPALAPSIPAMIRARSR